MSESISDRAIVSVTWQGAHGALPDSIAAQTPTLEVLMMLEEAIRTGGIPGIPADLRVDLTDYTIDRPQVAGGDSPQRLIARPKTDYGANRKKSWADYAEAFTIFAKYGPGEFMTCAEHDVLYAGPVASTVSESDRIRLAELGWRPNGNDGFQIFT